ncbi:unnamed protein product [Pleuronectes platessa]|uniref:Uncharacterized protein n=1 Tax=Pleuronectes platessa TaxID=8262 RepID=A0A9N7Z3U8_PLEPL|nr:unnamed protein product [Pleuronectes platessa]
MCSPGPSSHDRSHVSGTGDKAADSQQTLCSHGETIQPFAAEMIHVALCACVREMDRGMGEELCLRTRHRSLLVPASPSSSIEPLLPAVKTPPRCQTSSGDTKEECSARELQTSTGRRAAPPWF